MKNWQIYAIGLVTLAWNGFGALDYVMSATRNQSYFAQIPEDQRAGILAYLDAMPAWAMGFWALGVWAAVLGSVFILLRSRFSVPAFGASILGIIGTSVYTYLLAPPSMMSGGGFALLMSVAIVVVTLACLVFSQRMSAAGHFR